MTKNKHETEKSEESKAQQVENQEPELMQEATMQENPAESAVEESSILDDSGKNDKNNNLSGRNIFASFGTFILKVIRESVLWFFRGISSCAAQILGFLLVTSAIVIAASWLSGGVGSIEPDVTSPSSKEEMFRDYGGGDDKIAYIELDGIVSEGDSAAEPLGGGLNSITPAKVENALNDVRADKKIKGVLIYVTSPGGSPVASDRIFEIIEDFKNDTKAPVVVLMGDVAASGGYYISAAADKIYAHPSTITGSIGVIMETYNLKGLYDKIGVQKQVFKAGKYKDILNDSRDMTQEEKDLINSLMNDAYNSFIERVAQGRGMSVDDVKGKAEGKIYSGKSAKEAGLIDEVGTLDDAIMSTAKLSKLEKFKVVKIKGTSFWDDLLMGFSSTVGKFGLNLGNGIASLNQPSYKILYKLP